MKTSALSGVVDGWHSSPERSAIGIRFMGFHASRDHVAVRFGQVVIKQH
jgi:hypothetical protein